MINGNEYAFEDIRLNYLGREIIGFQGVDYETSKEHFNIKGRGNVNVAKGRGGKDHTATLTLLQSEIEAIQAQLPAGSDLTDISGFDVIVCYAPTGGTPTTDVLKDCRIPKIKKGFKMADQSMVVELPLLPFKILYNV